MNCAYFHFLTLYSALRTENLGGLMSIGKAGKAMTKQLGKTLTSLGDSPDKRGHQRLFLANNPQFNTLLGDHKPKGQRLPTKGASDLGLGMGKSSFLPAHF
jgi:hypothetical protein